MKIDRNLWLFVIGAICCCLGVKANADELYVTPEQDAFGQAAVQVSSMENGVQRIEASSDLFAVIPQDTVDGLTQLRIDATPKKKKVVKTQAPKVKPSVKKPTPEQESEQLEAIPVPEPGVGLVSFLLMGLMLRGMMRMNAKQQS